MSEKSWRIALLLPVEQDYSNRLIAGAIEYAQTYPELELVVLKLYDTLNSFPR